MKTRKKIKSILFILVLSLICLFLVYGVDVNNSLAETESAIETEPKILKKGPLIPPPAEYVKDEIIVKFKPEIKEEKIRDFHQKHGVLEKYFSPRGKFRVLKIPKTKTVSEMIEIFKKSPLVKYAEPNSICHAFWTPDDPGCINQWNFPLIDLEYAWQVDNTSPLYGGDPSVVAAILDTGVAYEDFAVPDSESKTVKSGVTSYQKGPDLINTNFVAGYDYINNDTHPNDNNAHGTHLAGTIAQTTNNTFRYAGVAFNTSIMPVKVLNYSGSGTAQALADGLYFAADNGADVINMSLGWQAGYDPGETVYNAIKYAYDKGVVLVGASGNEGKSTVCYPALYDEVIAVGAVDGVDSRASYSNYGTGMELVAPGGDSDTDDWIWQESFSPYDEGPPESLADPTDFAGWGYCGTSMSTPHVAALIALMIANGTTGVETIRTILHNTARDLGDSGYDTTYGYGRINAYFALLEGQPSISKIVFTTEPQVITVDSPSEKMTIQTQSSENYPVNVSADTTIILDSTSGTGEFSLSDTSWVDITFLTITSGTNSASFYYKDSTVGTPTITVSEDPDAGWTDATQEVNIVPLPDLTLIGSQDIVFSKSNPEVNETITISATIHNNSGDYAELNPINIGSQVNGANPATAGSYQQTYYPENINDGDYLTVWASEYNSDWVKIDLTAIKSIKKIYWHDTFFVSDNQPGDFTIKVSTDDVSYTTIDSVTGYTGSSYTKILDTPVEARYIQMDITARAAGYAATLDELEVYEIYGTIIRFYDGDSDAGGTQIGSDQCLPPVPGSGTKTASVEWTPTAEGTHNIYVVIDPDNLISESDETNNKDFKAIEVKPPPPPPPMTLYDFSSGGGIDKWFYDGVGSDEVPPASGPDIGQEVTDYSGISASDDTRYEDSLKNKYNTHRFKFKISESIGSITNIRWLWEGNTNNKDPVDIYIWRFLDSTWEKLGQAKKSWTDVTVEGDITANFGNYIDANGYLHLLAEKTGKSGSSEPLRTDYVKVEVTYSPPVHDVTPPAAITDLSASTGIYPGEINLTWTAPGDDGTTGTATSYDTRYSLSIIDTDEKFNSATQVTGEPTPQTAGTPQDMTISGLAYGTTYYFAIKTEDEVPNISELSNSPGAKAQVEVISISITPTSASFGEVEPSYTPQVLTSSITVTASTNLIPWIIRTYTNNTDPGAEPQYNGAGDPAGLVSPDGERTVPLKIWCPDFGGEGAPPDPGTGDNWTTYWYSIPDHGGTGEGQDLTSGGSTTSINFPTYLGAVFDYMVIGGQTYKTNMLIYEIISP